MRFLFIEFDSMIRRSTATAATITAFAAVAADAQAEHVAPAVGLVDIVKGQAATLAQDVSGLAIHQKFDAAFFH